jgi:hypothetical protein
MLKPCELIHSKACTAVYIDPAFFQPSRGHSNGKYDTALLAEEFSRFFGSGMFGVEMAS